MMTNEQIAAQARVEDLMSLLSADDIIYYKYNHPGIYSISIITASGNEIIVYVGKAQNMFKRMCQHIDSIDNNRKTNKYKVMREAQQRGFKIKFDVLQYSSFGEEDEKMWDDIGHLEGAMIRYYMPPLNYQIPKAGDYKHWHTQKSARYITLNDILMKESK